MKPEINQLQEKGYDQNMQRKRGVFGQASQQFSAQERAAIVELLATEIPHLTDRLISPDLINPNYQVVTQEIYHIGGANKFLAVDTTDNAVDIVLPDAKLHLGAEYIIYFDTDGGNDLTVSTDGTDTFRGAAGAGNDVGTFADAFDFLHIMAAANNVWLVLSEAGGSYA